MTQSRKFKVGMPHHVYNRGNQKEKVFLKAKDYNVFLKQLKKYSVEGDCRVLTYCLMPNHYHLLLRPTRSDSIPYTMHRLATMYSKYLQKEYGWVGHIFQGRYQSKIIDNKRYLNTVVEYIVRNPLEANLTDGNGDYRWLKVTPGSYDV